MPPELEEMGEGHGLNTEAGGRDPPLGTISRAPTSSRYFLVL